MNGETLFLVPLCNRHIEDTHVTTCLTQTAHALYDLMMNLAITNIFAHNEECGFRAQSQCSVGTRGTITSNKKPVSMIRWPLTIVEDKMILRALLDHWADPSVTGPHTDGVRTEGPGSLFLKSNNSAIKRLKTTTTFSPEAHKETH